MDAILLSVSAFLFLVLGTYLIENALKLLVSVRTFSSPALEPSVQEDPFVNKIHVVEEEEDTWMTPIFEYLTEETLPMDVKKARAVRHKSQRFAIINGTLYKKYVLGLWLRCVGPLQANYVLREIHEGSFIMHESTRSVVAKALKIGYYWPTMHKDAREIFRFITLLALPISQYATFLA
nr:reverse transcriptase domain-containing protein [Tanacetum cinerariifolium]